MKNILFIILSVILLSSCSAHSKPIIEEVTGIIPDGAYEIKLFYDKAETPRFIYITENSKIQSANADKSKTQVIDLSEKIIALEYMNGEIYAYGEFNMYILDAQLKSYETLEYPAANLNPRNVNITPDRNGIVYYDDYFVFLSQATEEAKQLLSTGTAGIGSIITLSPISNDIFYLVYRTEEEPYGAYIFDVDGNCLLNERLNAPYPVLYNSGVLLYQGPEANRSNDVYIYDISQSLIKNIKMEHSIESSYSTINQNGDRIVSCFQNDNGLFISVYDSNGSKITTQRISDIFYNGTVNIINGSDGLAINNKGDSMMMQYIDDTGYHLLVVNL